MRYTDQYHLRAAGRTARSLYEIISQVTYKDINRFSDVFKDIINSRDELRAYSGGEDTGIAYLAEAFIGDMPDKFGDKVFDR